MARRNYGAGRAFKRGTRWWISYYVEGLELRESCGKAVTTRAEAQRVLRDRQSVADRGFSPTRATVSDLLDLFLEDHRNQNRKATPTRRVEVLRRRFGSTRAHQLSPGAIKRFITELQASGRSGPTINRFRSILIRGYRLAERHGMRVAVPYWPRMAESAPKRDIMTREVFEQMRAALPEPYRAVLVAGWWTACRRGEILSWRWEHVDLEQGLILIPDSKSGEPRRIPLSSQLIGQMMALRIQSERDWPKCPWVFTRDGSTALRGEEYDRQWRIQRKQIGQPNLRFHALRHTAITRMRSAGVEEGAAMALSGHKTRAVFDRYGIQPEAALKDAMRRLEKLDEAEQNVTRLAGRVVQ